MTNQDIAQHRLNNQHIAGELLETPHDVVKYMGAMQAQDYAGAKWAIGLRLQNGNDVDIDNAMANGSIIRTHVLRPTWHFISPADARWMLDLTASRIKAASVPWYKKLELDVTVLHKSNKVLANALEGGKQLNRAEITIVLQQAGIVTDDLRFMLLLMHAELDKVICSGARQGKQFSYALFDDSVPSAPPKSKEESLAELAKRYFISRGPALVQDFTWWSGLTTTDAKTGFELVKHTLNNIKVDGKDYWATAIQQQLREQTGTAYLLPAFDEFAVAYKDRTATVNDKYLEEARHVIFDPSIIIDNQVVGTWKRTITKNDVNIVLNPFGKLNLAQTKAVEAAMERYRKFMIA